MTSKVELLFEQFDTNKDGVLDIDEVYNMLKKVEQVMQKSGKKFNVNSDMVKKLFELTDIDGDGKITADEMSVLLKNASSMNK